jgi:hypothetical protein
MPKVICTLPNASTSINGVAFVTHELGVISEEIGQDQADAFLQISGYLDQADADTPATAPARTTISIKKK